MVFEYSSSARIKYDPHRSNMKHRTKWWCVANVDREISRYYRNWIYTRYGLKLEHPAWDCHISIIRGEKPSKDLLEFWKKYDGMKIKFNYSHNVYPNKRGKFFALKVESNDLLNIRKELQLPTDYGFHITIGKLYKPLNNNQLKMIYSQYN